MTSNANRNPVLILEIHLIPFNTPLHADNVKTIAIATPISVHIAFVLLYPVICVIPPAILRIPWPKDAIIPITVANTHIESMMDALAGEPAFGNTPEIQDEKLNGFFSLYTAIANINAGIPYIAYGVIVQCRNIVVIENTAEACVPGSTPANSGGAIR